MKNRKGCEIDTESFYFLFFIFFWILLAVVCTVFIVIFLNIFGIFNFNQCTIYKNECKNISKQLPCKIVSSIENVSIGEGYLKGSVSITYACPQYFIETSKNITGVSVTLPQEEVCNKVEVEKIEYKNCFNATRYKTKEEFCKEASDYKRTKNKDDGQDGKIEIAEGKFVYRGVSYLIKVLRYFNYRDGFTTMGRDRISDCHAVVEYPDETRPIIDLIPNDYGSEFLYHDTLHSWNDKQTTEQQIEVCQDWAKRDIDNLLDGEISKRIDEGIKQLQEVKDKLDKKSKELKQ